MFYLLQRVGVGDPATAGCFYLNSGAESIAFGAGVNGDYPSLWATRPSGWIRQQKREGQVSPSTSSLFINLTSSGGPRSAPSAWHSRPARRIGYM